MGVAHNVGDVSPPSFERRLSLAHKLVTLVDGRNARDRAGLMVQYFVSNMRRNPEPGHSRYASAPQIVKAPPSHSRELIQPAFCSTEFLEGLGSEQRKDIRPRLV